MKLSIVTTLYDSAPYIAEFYARIVRTVRKITQDYELILVNDGSPDTSLEMALSLLKQDQRTKVIDLSRNFGHHKAMMTGLSHATGDLVFLIDCDLEEEPELLEKFFERFRKSSVDVVYGVQASRKGALYERLSGEIFWRAFNMLSSHPVTPNQLVARLMTRAYVDNLVTHRDQEPFIPGLWALTGFKQVSLTVKKHSKGRSSYTLSKKLAQFVNAITSFSTLPLVINFYIGTLVLFASSLLALYLIIRRLFFGAYFSGWPSLIVSVWFLGGLTIFSIGIVGIYISRTYTETKRRPFTVVRKVHSSEEQHRASAET